MLLERKDLICKNCKSTNTLWGKEDNLLITEYVYCLDCRWFEANNDIKRLNLGCGFRKFPNEVTIDIDPAHEPDILRDLKQGLPFEDNTFEFIKASHILEHLTNEDCLFMIRECWRVLKHKGQLEIYAPDYRGEGQWDFDHRCAITEKALKRFTRMYSAVSSQARFVKGCYFKIISSKYISDKFDPQFYILMEADKNG